MTGPVDQPPHRQQHRKDVHVRGLVGHSGYVGTTLKRQVGFDAEFRSTDIADIRGRHFDLLVCAGAPAQKWLANKEPEADEQAVDGLVDHLREVRVGTVVLVSTVDVFGDPDGVDEETPVETAGLHPYGRNRHRLERFVTESFERSLVVRLPALVGPGLRKNALHDLHHGHEVHKIDARGVFNVYPMVNLWSDITTALDAGLSLVHLTAAPVRIGTVARDAFGVDIDDQHTVTSPPRYDMRTRHAGHFGADGNYQYTEREAMLAIRGYAQSGEGR